MQNTNFKKNMPTFDIGNYIMREQRNEDVESFFDYYTDTQVNKYILCNIPRDIEEAKHDFYYWKNTFTRGDGAYFAIARKDDDKMIGSIGLTGFNSYHKRIEVSYDLAQKYWGKGIMSKCLNKICDYAFYEFKVNRVEANVAPENLHSLNLLNRNGFKKEGLLRQHRLHKGEFWDVILLSLLRTDFYK